MLPLYVQSDWYWGSEWQQQSLLAAIREQQSRPRSRWQQSFRTVVSGLAAVIRGVRRTHLDYFSHAIRKFTCRKGFQERDIYEYVLRLPERADEVFPVRGVDRGLAAHAGVNHS